MKIKTETLKLTDVIVDLSIQQREGGIDPNRVAIYKAEWPLIQQTNGDWKEKLIVYKTGSGTATKYVLASGFHRITAMKQCGQMRYEFEVRPGGRRDAFRYALGDNATHGMRRTPGDLKHAIKSLIADDEFGKLSDRQAAEIVRCDASYFSRVRKELTGAEPDKQKSEAGKKGNEAKKAKIDEPLPFDDAPLPPPPSIAVKGAVKPQTEESVQPANPLEPAHTYKQTSRDLVRDSRGRVVPGWLIPAFEGRAEKEAQAKSLMNARQKIDDAIVNQLVSKAIERILASTPECVCPDCDGHGCKSCDFRGWLTNHELNRMPASSRAKADSFDDANRGDYDPAADEELAATIQAPDTLIMRDAVGRTIPKNLIDPFGDTSLAFAADLVGLAASTLQSASVWNAWIESSLINTTQEIAKRIDGTVPLQVCTECDGAGCVHCRTSGFRPFEQPEAA